MSIKKKLMTAISTLAVLSHVFGGQVHAQPSTVGAERTSTLASSIAASAGNISTASAEQIANAVREALSSSQIQVTAQQIADAFIELGMSARQIQAASETAEDITGISASLINAEVVDAANEAGNTDLANAVASGNDGNDENLSSSDNNNSDTFSDDDDGSDSYDG
jgi:hypothetical protein